MSALKSLALSTLALSLVGTAAWAASPSSGEVNDDTLALEYTGSGPYLIPNVTGSGGDPLCEPAIPQVCDVYTLTVNISDEFRELEENQRESVRMAMSFAPTTGTEDLDYYLYDAGGAEIGSGTGSFGVQETISVPLKTLKNGTYTLVMVPFTPTGANYSAAVQVGKGAAASKAAGGFSVAPQVGSAPMTVTFDARGLSSVGAASGYVFDFGDGSAPVTDTDGVVEHTYTTNGQYLARVQASDPARGLAGASATVFVGELTAAKSSSLFGGAFGLGGLLALAGFGFAARRRRAQ
jgi:hypothetical protein